MRTGAVVIAVLGAILSGCGQATVPSVPPSPTPAIALATASPTAPAVATSRPTPKPTPLPVPPRPSGVKSRSESEATCGAPQDLCGVGDTIFKLSWEAPRAKGVEIRVYGVTTCFGEDSSGAKIDGHCLREHTALPSSIRVLLAKVPASRGKVTWRMDPGRGLAETRNGVPVHSIVLAAYNARGGHSIFVIANAGDRRLQRR